MTKPDPRALPWSVSTARDPTPGLTRWYRLTRSFWLLGGSWTLLSLRVGCGSGIRVWAGAAAAVGSCWAGWFGGGVTGGSGLLFLAVFIPKLHARVDPT